MSRPLPDRTGPSFVTLAAAGAALLAASCSQTPEPEQEPEAAAPVTPERVLEPYEPVLAAAGENGPDADLRIDWGSAEEEPVEVVARGGPAVLGCSLADVANLARCLDGKLDGIRNTAHQEAQRIHRESRARIAEELRKAQAEGEARVTRLRAEVNRAEARRKELQREIDRHRKEAPGRGQGIRRRGEDAAPEDAGDAPWEAILAPYAAILEECEPDAAAPGVARRGGFRFPPPPPPPPPLPSPPSSGTAASSLTVMGCKLAEGPARFESCLEGKVSQYRRDAEKVVADAAARTRSDLEKALAEARRTAEANLGAVRAALERTNASIAVLERELAALRAEAVRKARDTVAAVKEGAAGAAAGAGPTDAEKAAAWSAWLRSAGARRPFAFDAGEESRRPSIKSGYLLSLLSWIAYAPEEKARQAAESWGLRFIDRIDIVEGYGFAGRFSGSTQALILQSDEALFVAFQGSTTNNLAQDWLDNDLDFRPFPMPSWGLPVVLHHGFHEAMAVAYARVRDRIRPLAPGRRLWITGHSLGGAVAVLFAFRLEVEARIDVRGVHVHGAPPVGNGAWARAYDARIPNTHRWNIEGDPIPVLYQAPAFHHVGTTNNLYADGRVVPGDQRMFPYVPNPGSLEDLAVTHMDYWWRLSSELDAGERAALPTPPDRTSW